ncbi:MAG TPA: OmpA family protein [Vicinamibacterales bacterium]|nr:OmpA family protein [Vicinamibacterales bacterium]
MRKLLLAAAVAGVAVGGSTACATKGYVNSQVNQVNDKVDSMGEALEETQERTRQNEGRIGEVDAKAGAAQGAADRAQQSAMTADGKAVSAGDAARRAGERADAVDAASKRLIYEVVLSEDQGNFKFGTSDLPDAAKARIDELVAELTANPQGAWFEIEGHTDSTGPAEINYKLGLDRAESVKRYLYEQHQIPLHKMNVISYGEDKPMAPNNTTDGRAQNRRVVIRVLI